MWRVRCKEGPDVVVRLPRRVGSAEGVAAEAATLQQIQHCHDGSVLTTPIVRHLGAPHDSFPHKWMVLEWIDGDDAWSSRHELQGASLATLGDELAEVVNTVSSLDIDAPSRAPGDRGGSLLPLLERLERWLTSEELNAAGLVDVSAIRRVAHAAREVVDEPVKQSFVHGDLIPGNLLVAHGRLAAVIDWGGAGRGDIAQDYAPAWSVLTSSERQDFRRAVNADDAAWIRGRTIELEHAVGGVLYYVPKRHALGDVMARTLDRILCSV